MTEETETDPFAAARRVVLLHVLTAHDDRQGMADRTGIERSRVDKIMRLAAEPNGDELARFHASYGWLVLDRGTWRRIRPIARTTDDFVGRYVSQFRSNLLNAIGEETLESAADRSGVSRRRLRRIIDGRTLPGGDEIIKFERAYQHRLMPSFPA
ncbi:helix-turn-helix domain-containing protein [Leifsonia naganoensis]|uniref:HTH cro/C1-type domain-containing protein n=1 Tax=Leifsonia naganoensis TaxID=150025 RepID=A0A853DTS1_9MICO|nr:helix-turn-helix transcriptional regulator [Leifsonia naganoensis]NYK09045.1 hypothetical protein [Leifsonia naganoensis]